MREADRESSEYVVHGDELKKIVRLGRRRPVPFAFCPSVGDDVSLFAVHRKRKPELIARTTRQDSGQTKVAFGTFVIIGKTMVLTCIKDLPAIAKKLKKHMRDERLPLSIRVLDMQGNEIEADVAEDDGDDPFGDDEDDDDDMAPGVGGGVGGGDALAARIEAIRPPIIAAGGTRGDRLRDLLSALIATQEGGRRHQAEPLLARLEDEVRALMNSSDRPQMPGAAPRPKPKPAKPKPRETAPEPDPEPEPEPHAQEAVAPEPPAAPQPDNRAEMLRVARRIATLKPRIAALADPAASRLTAALAVAVRALKGDELAAAGRAVTRITEALERVEDQAAHRKG